METPLGSFALTVRRSKYGLNEVEHVNGNGSNGDGSNGSDGHNGENGNANGRDRRVDASGLNLSFRTDKLLMQELRRITPLEVLDRPAWQTPTISQVENMEPAGKTNQGRPGDLVKIEGGRGFCAVGVWGFKAPMTEQWREKGTAE